jgi:uncharacterized protein (DUF779 family)
MHIEDTQRLVTEIEMLKVVLYLVSRKQQYQQQQRSLLIDVVPSHEGKTVLEKTG